MDEFEKTTPTNSYNLKNALQFLTQTFQKNNLSQNAKTTQKAKNFL